MLFPPYKYSTLAAIALMALLVADIILRINSFIGESNGSTSLIVALNALVAFIFLLLAKNTRWKVSVPTSARLVLMVLLLWNVITFVRGAIVAADYWAWKSLLTTHLFMLTMPLAIVIGLNPWYYTRVYWAILCLVFPIALLVIPVAISFDTELFQRAALPVFMLLLLMPFLGRRWRFVVVAVAIISVCMDVSYRANVLRILVALLLAVLYLVRIRFHPKALNAVWLASLAAPLILLTLGVTGRYDVFRDGIKINESVSVVEGGQTRESALNANTRSFLYDEVLSSMRKRDSSFIAGQGAGTGYESVFFAQAIIAANGRGGSEVGFLNTLLYSGLVGVFLYAAMLFLAAFYAFNRSNNDICKLFGVFLLFKWLLFFMEDIPRMDLNFLCTWMIIGLCLSNTFRGFDNVQVKKLFRAKANTHFNRTASQQWG